MRSTVRVLSPLIHAIVDYPIALALLGLPQLAVFHLEGPAEIVPRAVGVAVLLYSLLTRYDLAAFRVLPLRTHIALDVFSAVLLGASPFLFGFWRLAARMWIPHLIVGAALFTIALITDTAHDRITAA
jgi:hypothetical protein